MERITRYGQLAPSGHWQSRGSDSDFPKKRVIFEESVPKHGQLCSRTLHQVQVGRSRVLRLHHRQGETCNTIK